MDCRVRPAPRLAALLALAVLLLVAAPLVVPPAGAQVASVGEWRTLSQTMPINPIHAALLRTGKILVVAGSENDSTQTLYRAAIWDPATNTVSVQTTPWDLFCNAMSQLADGRLLLTGGNKQYNPFRGIRTTTAFDPATESFIQLQDMARGRWYPSNALLSDGTTVTFGGWLETSGGTNSAVEIYTVGAGWTPELFAPFTPPLYPWLHLLPDGRLFFSGSTPASRFFNSGSRTWSSVVALTNLNADRFYGASVLLPLRPETNYAPRVMIMGGGHPSTATAEIIDLSQASPAWRSLPPMSAPRSDMNAVLLPNGRVLALGGSAQRLVPSTASLDADLFDPATETWSPAGRMAFPRLYHSVALLMPDATVWVAGSNPTEGVWESRIETYAPPYLFTSSGARATRPTITGAPSVVGYGASFTVQTPDAANIASAVFIRPGSATHAFDFDQRFVGLSFTKGSGVLTVTAPPNPAVAPAGYYMLFLLNSAGVPSVARFVRISETPGNAMPRGTITSPSADVTIAPGGSVTFAGSGTDADGSIARYSWVFPGGSPGGSTVATPGAVAFANPGRYIVSLTVTDNLGDTDPSPPTRVVTVQGGGFTASFTSPAAGATVSGTVTVGMATSGGTGSITYRLAADGTTVSTQTTSATTASYAWDTRQFADGARTLTLTATDGAGNTSTVSRSVTVANGTAGSLGVQLTSPLAGQTVSGSVAVNIWVEGTSTPPYQFTMSVDGTVVGTATSSATHVTLAWDTRQTPDGLRTLLVSVRDAAGRVGSRGVTVTVQNGTAPAPTASFTSPAAGATVSGTVTVGMAVSGGTPNYTYRLSIDGALVFTSVTAATSTTYSWNTTGASNGSHTLSLTVTDADGRASTATRSVTVQNSASPPPLAASFTSPAAGATVSGTVAVGMAASGGTPGYTYRLSIDGTSVFSTTTTATSASYSWNTPSGPDGTRTLGLTVTDSAGQTSTVTRTVTVQNSAAGGLDVFITTPSEGATVSGTVTVNVWVEKASGSANVFTLTVGGQTVWTQTTSGVHVYGPWDSRTVPDGPATLVASVRDATGKTGSVSRAVTVRNGTPPPPPLSASFTSPAAGATVSGTVTVGMAASGGSPGYTYRLAVDGTQVFSQTTSSTSASYSWSTTGVSNGSHTLTLTVTDSAGQTSTATRTVTVQNGTAPPALAASFTSPAANATVSGTVTVGMAASGGSPGYTYRLAVDGTQVFSQTTSSTSASYSWSTTGVANGSHTLTLTVTDAAGATATATRTVTVDNATGGTLTVQLTSPLPGATVSGTVAVNVWVEGTTAAPYAYTLLVDGTAIATMSSSSRHVTFSWNTQLTPNGNRSLTARVTDAAGRAGEKTIAVVVQNP
jgi:hypothetical protein